MYSHGSLIDISAFLLLFKINILYINLILESTLLTLFCEVKLRITINDNEQIAFICLD